MSRELHTKDAVHSHTNVQVSIVCVVQAQREFELLLLLLLLFIRVKTQVRPHHSKPITPCEGRCTVQRRAAPLGLGKVQFWRVPHRNQAN